MSLNYDTLSAVELSLVTARSLRSKLSAALNEVESAFDDALMDHDQETPVHLTKSIREFLGEIETKQGELEEVADAMFTDYYDQTPPEDDPGDPLYDGPVDHMREKCVR
jgi:hypothetical protein